MAELLPFEGDLLDEESAQREVDAFSEALVPEHSVHGQPALWWSQGAARKSAPSGLLVPDTPTRRSLLGQPWSPPLVRLLVRPHRLH